jgi:hypothetical protein
MLDQAGPMNPEPARSAIDRQAVTAAGQVLMSAIWLEHRVRSFSTRLATLPIHQASVLPFESSSPSHQSDRGLPMSDGRGD